MVSSRSECIAVESDFEGREKRFAEIPNLDRSDRKRMLEPPGELQAAAD